ncbi:MAG: DinB family protein [Bernardetiaceae bacterium]|nr:DinB family protein [Bernardetiaceae bacterium]
MSLQRILMNYTDVLKHYSEALDGYSDTQFMYKSDETTWSLSQMYLHLFMASKGLFLQKAQNCLAQTRGSTEGEKTEIGLQVLKQGHFPKIKIKPPEKYRAPDPENAPKVAFSQIFDEHLKEVEALTERIANEKSTYKTEHVIFGMLTAEEWLELDTLHWKHHLSQQKELEEFASATTI